VLLTITKYGRKLWTRNNDEDTVLFVEYITSRQKGAMLMIKIAIV
jgi:hypothetical protein